MLLEIRTPPALEQEPFQGTEISNDLPDDLITSSGSPALTKGTTVFSEFTFYQL